MSYEINQQLAKMAAAVECLGEAMRLALTRDQHYGGEFDAAVARHLEAKRTEAVKLLGK